MPDPTTQQMADARAFKTLMSSYWSPTGWREGKNPNSREAVEHGKAAGLMFDVLETSHDEVVTKALQLCRAITREAVANAFVASLESRDLPRRSTLGSYALTHQLPKHTLDEPRKRCTVCGMYGGSSKIDRSVFNFERFKWGGVRHEQLEYAAFDLEQFLLLPPVEPTPAARALLASLLDAIEAAPQGTSAASLHKFLPKSIKANKAERDVLVGILGMAGVLRTAGHPGYHEGFVEYRHRTLPERRFVDMHYPACWWRREDGVNQAAISYWFGHLA